MSRDAFSVDPYLVNGPAPETRLRPCRECENGVGTWWPSYPDCWKCLQPGKKFFDERPAPRKRVPRAVAPLETAAVDGQSSGPLAADTSLAVAVTDTAERPAPLVPAFPKRKRTQMQKHLEVIARQDRNLRRESAEIVLDSFATFDLPEDGSKPEGWSERKYRTARLARLPDKEAPAALRHAARILESYRRSEALEDRKPSPTLNCDIQVFVRQEVNATYNYETVEVKAED